MASPTRSARDTHASSAKVNYRINVGNINGIDTPGIHSDGQIGGDVRGKYMVYAGGNSRSSKRGSKENTGNPRKNRRLRAKSTVERMTRRIRSQMRSKRGKEAKTRKTLGQRKEAWLHPQVADAKQEEVRKGELRAPWEAPPPPQPRRRREAGQQPEEAGKERERQTASNKIKGRGEKEWKKRWHESAKGRHLYRLSPEPSQANLQLHAGRPKPHSALLTQLRTGKIGFLNFLYSRKVPGVWSGRCTYGEGLERKNWQICEEI